MTATDRPSLPAWIHEFLPKGSPNILSLQKIFHGVDFHPTPLYPGAARLETRLPEHFSDDGQLHGGVYTILLDTILAVAVWTRLDQFEPLVTINLKTDFYQSVAPSSPITLEAHCDGIVDEVAVSRGDVRDDKGNILAHAAGTFLVGGASSDRGSRL